MTYQEEKEQLRMQFASTRDRNQRKEIWLKIRELNNRQIVIEYPDGRKVFQPRNTHSAYSIPHLPSSRPTYGANEFGVLKDLRADLNEMMRELSNYERMVSGA